MQAITRMQRAGFNHPKVALIAAGLLMTLLAGVVVFQLSQDSNATSNVSAPATTMQRFYAAKEARQDRLELAAAALTTNATQLEALQRFYAHKEASMDAEFSAITAQPTQIQRVAVDKESRLAVQEQLRSDLAASTKRQETMRRYYAHKEAQLDALP